MTFIGSTWRTRCSPAPVSVCLLLASLVIPGAHAAPTAQLHPDNQAITNFSFDYDAATRTLTLFETWSANGIGFITLNGITGSPVQVVRHVTNNTSSTLTRVALEVLDLANDLNDVDYDLDPLPAYVPSGFSTSNNFDQLSFAQGSGLSRFSSVFPQVDPDELGQRDFIDFFGGTVSPGAQFVIAFGLEHASTTPQPVLLMLRNNTSSDGSGAHSPEPATLLPVGIGLLTAAALRHRARAAR